jgi:UDPglucose 6-dehydrogenase
MKNIGIIGNGFVGSAIAAGFGLHANVRVYDKDPRKTLHTIEDTINKSDFVFVGVPTPMEFIEGGKIDLSIMNSVFEDINNITTNSDTIFIIKSTVIPGTTNDFQDRYPNLKIVFNPEFLTERSANLDFINASRIVLGGEPENVKKVAELYRDRFPYTKIVATDAKSAEMIKYMCNCFFATKISFMNEMFLMSRKLGTDWKKIMEGFISDGRIGNSHIEVPGHDGDLGFGGKCFPKDLNAFIEFFAEQGIEPHMLMATWKRNQTVRRNINWAEIEGAVSKGKK